MLWNPEQTVERVEAAFEARMLRALQQYHQREIPEDQYRRFEQFTTRFQSLIAHAAERIRAVFRSPDSGNAAAIARVVQEGIRSIQTEIGEIVAAAAAKGDGPVLEAMQAAAGALAEPLSLPDLEETLLFDIAAELPPDAKLEAGRFFTIERKPEPKITATFDASNAPNLWERASTREAESRGPLRLPHGSDIAAEPVKDEGPGKGERNRSFSRQEVESAIDAVFADVMRKGRRHFHGKLDTFSALLDLYKRGYAQGLRDHCPEEFSCELDLEPLEDFCRITNDSTQRTPQPSGMELWLMRSFPPRFSAAIQRIKNQLLPSPLVSSGPGMVTRKQVINAIGALQGRLEGELSKLPDIPGDTTARAEASTVLNATRAVVVLRCPEPLRSREDFRPLHEAMQRIQPSEPFSPSPFKQKAGVLLSQMVEGLLEDFERKMEAGFDFSQFISQSSSGAELAERNQDATEFRWSWSDDELFGKRKIAQLRRCHRTNEQTMELWRETEQALFEGLAQWKQRCLREVDPALVFTTTNEKRKMTLEQALNALEREFRNYVTGHCREMIYKFFSSAFWGDPLSGEQQSLEEALLQLCEFEGRPDPAFIHPAVNLFYSRVTQSEPVNMPPLGPEHITQSNPFYFCPGNMVAAVSKEQVQIAMGKGFSYNEDFDDSILTATQGMLGSGEQYQKNNHIIREAISALRKQLNAIEQDIEGMLQFQSRANFTRFWKRVLREALQIIETFHFPEVNDELLARMKNVASFHISWNCRDAVLRVGGAYELPQDEAASAEISDFYPHPSDASYVERTEGTTDLDHVSSRPLTKEELLDQWEAAIDRMVVRTCKRGFMIMQDDSICGIDLEDIRKHGNEIIEKFCSSGAVGKRRMRLLRKELMAAVQLHDEISSERPKLRHQIQEIMTMCLNEFQRMFANIVASRERDNAAVASPDIPTVPALSSEPIQCVLLSAFKERRAHMSAEEKRLHAEAIADRRVDDAYNRWHSHVQSTIDDAFAHGPDRMTLDECLGIVELLRSETEQGSTLGRLAPDYWSICLKQNQAVHDEIERRLREKFAMAAPLKIEKAERPERIPKQQLIGFISAMQRENTQLYTQMDAMIKAMEKPTAARVMEFSKQHLAEVQAIDAELPDILTLEECRNHCERIRQLRGIPEAVPDVSDEFRRVFDEGQQWFDAEIERRLPELFGRSGQQSGSQVPKEILWKTLLDLEEAGAPERVTQVEFVALNPDFERTHQWCGQCLRTLYEDLPSQVTRDDCRVFVYAARATMLPLENAYPFSPTIQKEYKRSFNVICECSERAVNRLFAQLRPQQLPSSPHSDHEEKKQAKAQTTIVIPQSMLNEWWDAVREEAGRRLQVAVQESEVEPGQAQRTMTDRIPVLPHGNGLSSAKFASSFCEELQRRIEQMPQTIAIGGAAVAVPDGLQEFLSQELEQMRQELLSRGWQVRVTPRGVRVDEISALAEHEAAAEPPQPEVSPSEQISDFLSIYDITPDKAADSLSDAIAGHVARAATEALTMQAQTLSGEEFERTEGELRKGIGWAAERARSLLAPTSPERLTTEQLSAALQQTFEHAFDGLNLSEATVGSMRAAIEERRTAVGKAQTHEDLITFIVERGEGGRGEFEETARMHRNAREESQRRRHGERVRQSQEQISAGLEQLTALSEAFAAKATQGATETERQSAAEETERLRAYIQTILGMYQGKSDSPRSEE